MTARPTIAVYRDFLLPFSETFIQAQAGAMRHFDPVFVGRSRVDGIALDEARIEVVDNGGLSGMSAALRYRAGQAPEGFVTRVRARRPVLIHAHFGPDALNAYPLQRRLHIPLIVTFHGYDTAPSAGRSDGLLERHYKRRRHLLADRAACILAVSDFIRKRLIDLGVPERQVRTHRIGVDTTRFIPAARTAREPVVLGIGRFVEKKGFEYLIDAMQIVERQVPGARLVMIGEGPLREDLENRASARLGRYEFVGPISSEDVVTWLQHARALAVPSVTTPSGDTEGLPMTVIEALASGLPVAASEHAGIPEAVIHEHTGLLSRERDVAATAENLVRLLTDDDDWDRLSSNGVTHVRRGFDLKRQTEILEAMYAEFS
jgi:colanic acid/amylovoran biosynthesis glycosyltransferase